MTDKNITDFMFEDSKTKYMERLRDDFSFSTAIVAVRLAASAVAKQHEDVTEEQIMNDIIEGWVERVEGQFESEMEEYKKTAETPIGKIMGSVLSPVDEMISTHKECMDTFVPAVKNALTQKPNQETE